MKLLKSISLIFNLKTLIVVILSVSSTIICDHFGIKANFPMTIIGIAVVFPIVFSINGAYKRRETALNHYGTLKAFGRALFLANRDWVPDNNVESEKQLKQHLLKLLTNCRDLFTAKPEELEQEEQEVYDVFSELSLFVKGFRKRGLASGEVSRSNQYLSKMVDAFESMKHIFQYRTPKTLRTYSKIFIYLVPIVYGPYFVHITNDLNFNFFINIAITLIMPILLSVVLVSLDNIQDQLEDPFDQIGEDDVRINAEKYIEQL